MRPIRFISPQPDSRDAPVYNDCIACNGLKFWAEGGLELQSLISFTSRSLPRLALATLLAGAALGAAQTGAAQTKLALIPAPREANLGQTTDLPDKILVAVSGPKSEEVAEDD